jgi:membrane dipeptidase
MSSVALEKQRTTSRALSEGVVWDNHACMPLRADDSFLPELERVRRSGVNAVTLNIGFAEFSLLDHLRVISYMRQWLAKRPDEYRLVATVDDIRQCKRDGKLGVLFDIEGMCPVQDAPSFVQTFYELGVRWMLIAYNRNNRAGGGCLDEDCGLTDIGRGIIDEMERVGMLLCVSHTGARTAAEALEYTRNPVIFSHSNAKAVTAHPRNISDDLMRACARKGGVIGINGIGPFLGSNDDMVGLFLQHVRHTADLVGPEHVGISLDYVFDTAEMDEFIENDPNRFPSGLSTQTGIKYIGPESMEQIAEGLARDKFSNKEIRGILGENWLRVASAVWR